ncbi:hypothetical protein BT69DRAFT_589975 [Atractiella rhizophila]|nr:hypothetical protein BT69DRAFT_589975 [Atractiella rhizophila]
MTTLPSLRLDNVLFGHPNPGPHTVLSASISGESYWLLASQKDIILLSEELQVLRVTPFDDAFPSYASPHIVSALAYDPEDEKIAALSGNRIAVWTVRGNEWIVHSSFTASMEPSTLDISQGFMVLGGRGGVSFWSCEEDVDIPVWKKTGLLPFAAISWVALSRPFGFCAFLRCNSNVVEISQLVRMPFSSVLLPSIWHPEPLRSIYWRPRTTSEKVVLLTETSSGILRLWSTMLDSPNQFCLWYNVQTQIFSPQLKVLRSFWMGRLKIDDIAQDLCSICYSDGSLGDVDRTLPTCLSYKRYVFAPRFMSRRHLPHLQHICVLSTDSEVSNLDSLSFLGWNDDSLLLLHANLPTVPSSPSPQSRLRWMTQGHLSSIIAHDKGFLLASAGGDAECWRRPLVRWPKGTFLPVHRNALLLPLSDASTVMHLTPSNILLENAKSEQTFSRSLPRRVNHILLDIVDETSVVFLDEDGTATLWDFVSQETVFEARLAGSGKVKVATKDLGGRSQFLSLALIRSTGVLEIWNMRKKGQYTEWEKFPFHREDMLNVNHLTFAFPKLGTVSSGPPDTLKIFDLDEAQFTSGLECSIELNALTCQMSFILLSNSTPVLAIMTSRDVKLYTQRRIDSYARFRRWEATVSIKLDGITNAPLTSLAWLQHGLVVSAGSQIFAFSSSLIWSHEWTLSKPSDLLTLTDTLQLPLPEFHPQVLSSCFASQQLAFIEDVLAILLASYDDVHSDPTYWMRVNDRVKCYYVQGGEELENRLLLQQRRFSRSDCHALMQRLQTQPFPFLSDNEREQLLVLIEVVGNLEELNRAVDPCGRRYLLAMRSFFISRQLQRSLIGQSRLKYRDVLWAYHSESQTILLTATLEACGQKLKWTDAKSLGIFMWIRSPVILKEQIEAVARFSFIATDERDPETATLFYLALRKKAVVQGLWKQSPGHALQKLMVQFLVHNFEEERWRIAAVKNAYSLLGKRRYYLAAGFFLLADRLQDAVNVCLQQLDDFQLAIAIARTYDGDDGAILHGVLENYVIPFAFGRGYRWLACWAFWMLNRRDLAVRVIVSPFSDLVAEISVTPETIKINDPIFEDPSLAILFIYLRDHSLQTLKGSKFISTSAESKFILHMCRSLRALGCHYLAVDLAKNYRFLGTGSNPADRGAGAAARFHFRRQSTIRIDEELPSQTPSGTVSPTVQQAKKATQLPPEFDFADFNF